MDKKPDRRVQRTRTLLRDSLIALILEKGYDAVTIQDITDRANLGRATFYLHFKDKDDLLVSMMEEIQQDVMERTSPLSPDDNFLVNGQPPSLLAFQHASEHADFYRAMLGEGGLAGVMTRFRKSGAARVQAQIEPLFPPDASPIPVEILAHYLMGGLNALLAWWLENNRPHSAEYMAQVFHRLATMGLLGMMSSHIDRPPE
jgi:AcrR family transcriptional regulator